MKNIRAIASIMIILGSVLVQLSYKLMSDSPSPALAQHFLPAVVGIILIHHGVKGLLRPPSQQD